MFKIQLCFVAAGNVWGFSPRNAYAVLYVEHFFYGVKAQKALLLVIFGE